MRWGQAPEGYTFLELNIVGTTPTFPVRVLVCLKCGSMVGNTAQHDVWHGPATVVKTDVDSEQHIFDDFDLDRNKYLQNESDNELLNGRNEDG